MSTIEMLLGGWRLALGGFLVGVIAGGGGAWQVRDWMAVRQRLAEAHADTQAAQAVTRTVIRRAEAGERVVTRYVAGAARIRTVTHTIVQEVPHVVTVEVDRAYGGLPVGLVRLYNASGRGVLLSSVPDPAGRADDAASGLLPSAFAAVAADNNGAANACREQLSALQDWVRAQAGVR